MMVRASGVNERPQRSRCTCLPVRPAAHGAAGPFSRFLANINPLLTRFAATRLRQRIGSRFMYSIDYEFEDEGFEDAGRQQLEEYEMYVREQNGKANALLTIPAAHILARPLAEDLARLVKQHGTHNGRTSALEMLRNTVAEDLITEVMRDRQDILRRPVNRAGHIGVRRAVDAACLAFESLLAAEAAK